MKKAVNIYLDEELHKAAKKRVVDLETNLSEYISSLIEGELERSKKGSCKPADDVA